MSLNEQQNIFMQHVSALINKAHELDLVITAGELYRTPEQQKLYVQAGRSKTMNSQHLKRMAIDLNFFIRKPDGGLNLVYEHEKIRLLGQFWESLDSANRWGGNWSSFKDTPHFERRVSKATETQVNAVAISSSKRGRELLKSTVGFQCDNEKDDVELVQRLINANKDRFGLDKELVCDGLYGRNTLAAIKAFEKSILGEDKNDGKIKPGDETLANLCSALPQQVDQNFLQFLYLAGAETDIAQLTDAIVDCMNHYQINNPLLQAHFLAQIGHESGELRFREEIASGRAYEGRRDLGNTEPGDGPRFKGRGLIQLTGRANYREYARINRFDVPVLEQPEAVAQDPRLCVDVAGWFWDSRKINLLAGQDKLEEVTRRINGGLNGLAHRRKLLLRAKTLLGLEI